MFDDSEAYIIYPCQWDAPEFLQHSAGSPGEHHHSWYQYSWICLSLWKVFRGIEPYPYYIWCTLPEDLKSIDLSCFPYETVPHGGLETHYLYLYLGSVLIFMCWWLERIMLPHVLDFKNARRGHPYKPTSTMEYQCVVGPGGGSACSFLGNDGHWHLEPRTTFWAWSQKNVGWLKMINDDTLW